MNRQLQLCVAPAVMLLLLATANAETCLDVAADGSTQPLCMSNEQRLSAIATPDGIDGGKHIVHDVTDRWRIDHRLLPAVATPTRVNRLLYAGRLTDSKPGNLSLGGEIAIGRMDPGVPSLINSNGPTSSFELGAVRGTARLELNDLIDSWHVALGVLLMWDMDLLSTSDTIEVAEHRIAPLSAGLLEIQRASNGNNRIGVRIEAGRAWSSNEGWSPLLVARAGFERHLFTVGEKPLWLYASASYQSGDEALRGEFGLKVPLPTAHNRR